MTMKHYDSGRSMVEMLGTLAIIGVLSVGAIAGYSYGMDKYRANQTINDVMLLGVDVITQASRTGGMPDLSAEWGTKTTVGYDFTVVANPDNETQYGIQIDGVPARVCKMVGDALKPMASVYVNDDEHITEEDPCDESDNNTMEFYFATSSASSNGGDQCKIDTDCGEGKYCDNGWCFNGTAPEGTYGCDTSDSCCSSGEPRAKDGDDCTINTPNDGMCYYGTCVAKGCTYDENKCTGKNEYCASPNTGCTEAFQNSKTGTCVEVDYIKVDGTPYYVSSHTMSWWDADASCKALGKMLGKSMSLLSVSDLVTETDGSAWEGDGGTHSKTALANELYSKRWNSNGYPYIWTKNWINGTCGAYNVGLSNGYVSSDIRSSYYNYSAVCK